MLQYLLPGDGIKAKVRRFKQYQRAADQGDGRVENVAHVVDDGTQHVGVGIGLEVVVSQLFVDLFIFRAAAILMVKDLDDLLTVHDLLNEGLALADALLLAHKVFGRAAADLAADKQHAHDAQQHHQRKPEAVVEHDEQHRRDDDARLQYGGERLGDQLAEGIDVVGVAAHDVAVLVRVKIADGKVLHFVEHRAAHFVEEALRKDRQKLVLQRHHHQRHQIQGAKRDDLGNDLLAGDRPAHVALQAVFHDGQDVLLEYRGDRRGGGRKDGAGDDDGHQLRVGGKEHFDQARNRFKVDFRPLHLFHILLIHRRPLPSSVLRKSRGKWDWRRAAPRGCPAKPPCRCPE